MNPICGVIPGSPTTNVLIPHVHDDDIDRRVGDCRSDWQKEMSKYVKERIKPESRYKTKKYIEDPMLNKICNDKSLFHVP